MGIGFRPLHALCVFMYVFGVLHDVCYMLCGLYTWYDVYRKIYEN